TYLAPDSSITQLPLFFILLLFFFNDPATTEIYTLSLHDALPIWAAAREAGHDVAVRGGDVRLRDADRRRLPVGSDQLVPERQRRSEEHTSELQSRRDLVCRLLLEKKKQKKKKKHPLEIKVSNLAK